MNSKKNKTYYTMLWYYQILAESKQEAIDLCVFFLCFISMLNYIYIYIYIYKQLLVFSKFLHGDVSVLIDECYVRNISSKGFINILKGKLFFSTPSNLNCYEFCNVFLKLTKVVMWVFDVFNPFNSLFIEISD